MIRDTFSHTSEEEKVALDNIILPTTSVVETESAIGHVPLVVHKGDKKDAVYLSETSMYFNSMSYYMTGVSLVYLTKNRGNNG